jgi:hypothetical protein
MRRYFATIIAALAMLTAVMLPATVAYAATSHTSAAHVLCSENWTGFVGPPGNASVAWRNNTCGHQLRVRIFCNGGTFPQFLNGGWVRTVGLHSGKTCPASEPNLASAYGQYRNGPGDAVTTVQFL